MKTSFPLPLRSFWSEARTLLGLAGALSGLVRVCMAILGLCSPCVALSQRPESS